MSLVEFFEPFMGRWQGVNRLRMMPTDDYVDSAATAIVAVAAKGFVTIAYTWSDGDKPQDGLLLVQGTSEPEGAAAVWVDSWHSGAAWMQLAGPIEAGKLRLIGSYPAPPGPDWGWEIDVEPGERRLSMHNVMPGEDPYQAVEITYGERG